MELVFSDPALKVKGLTLKLLRSGKAIFKITGENSHFTLHPGHHTGFIDLHKTCEQVPDHDPSKHETLGKISKAELAEKLNAIGPYAGVELLGLMRPIRLGWMIRRGLAVGPAFPPGSVLCKVTGIRVRLEPQEFAEPFKKLMQPPEFYEEVLQHPGTAYWLFDWTKPSSTPYGVLLTYRGLHGHAQMVWFKYRDMLRWAARWEPVFRELLSPLLPR